MGQVEWEISWQASFIQFQENSCPRGWLLFAVSNYNWLTAPDRFETGTEQQWVGIELVQHRHAGG